MKGHRTDEEDEDEGGTEWTGKTAMKGTERTGEKGKGSLYIAQYPVRWTAQSALHVLPSLADLFIPTPTRLLREAF